MRKMVVIAHEVPLVAREGNTAWGLTVTDPAFVAVAVASGVDRKVLTGENVDRVLRSAATEDRRELLFAGWLVQVYGPAWSRTRLVAQLRMLMVDGHVASDSAPLRAAFVAIARWWPKKRRKASASPAAAETQDNESKV